MKKLVVSSFLALAVLMIAASCQKEETTGDLIVYAEDINGTALADETIYLYNDEADFNNVIYSDSKVADDNGSVVFELLEPGEYFVDCDFNNSNGGVTTITGSGSVSAGYETTITITP